MIASSVSFNLKCGLRYLQFKAGALDRFQVKQIQRNTITLKVVFPCWPKHDKPILDVHAVRADQDHFLHLETRFHDYCLLEGYRNSAKNRLTETANHYISAKRPFELPVLHSAIPASEWNTLNDVIVSKIPTNDIDKPWVWLQKIKEHYVGASTLMQDRYHSWAKMSQADQTYISAWKTAVCTATGRCSFGNNADEFMRDKFLFGLNESFSHFHEDIFYRDGQRRPDDPPFTLAFVVSEAISFEAAQHTNKLLANSTIEEQVHYATSHHRTKTFKDLLGRPELETTQTNPASSPPT